MPHRRLLNKLDYYSIIGKNLDWIESFLSNRTQRVILDGKASDPCNVVSGVPQGTVLGPLLFLIYINDLPDVVNSNVRLFADDCILYRHIKSTQDSKILQNDLFQLEKWESDWGMEFHPDKCQSMQIIRGRGGVKCKYTLRGHTLEDVDSVTYLGITIHKSLKWHEHVNKTVAKANKSLGFLKRNVKTTSTATKSMAYQSLVKPITTYCSTVWDPSQSFLSGRIEAVQNRAARYCLNRYQYTDSITLMREQLHWETLQAIRAKARIIMLYKITHNLIAVSGQNILIPTTTRTRSHDLSYRQIRATTNIYKFSFFPRAVLLWNRMPVGVLAAPTIEVLKLNLANCQLPSLAQ